MKNRPFTPIAVVDVATVAMAEAGGEIIMMPMHVMQIMMQGLHEDVEEDLHLLMTREIVFTVEKVVIMPRTVIKNKQISEVESYNMVTMHLAVHDDCSKKLFAMQQKMHSTTIVTLQFCI